MPGVFRIPEVVTGRLMNLRCATALGSDLAARDTARMTQGCVIECRRSFTVRHRRDRGRFSPDAGIVAARGSRT
jgi:hypothetical protein